MQKTTTSSRQNDFHQQLADSQDESIRQILNKEYLKIFPAVDDIKVLSEKEQKNTHADIKLYIRGSQGQRYSLLIEEKIRSKEYAYHQDLAVEILSAEEFNTAGWLISSKANFLCYVWNGLPAFVRYLFLPLQLFKYWLLPTRINKEWEIKRAKNKSYTTVNLIVPLDDEDFQSFLTANGGYYHTLEDTNENLH